jgi:gamma-glutamylcyclotransferase (GGCT)/AIG2-like uncharacterized protein YtfP
LLITFTTDTIPDAQVPQDQGAGGVPNTVNNFLSGKDDADEQEPGKPVQYFFYGSLMDEQKLTQVLGLIHPPVLRPATIVGYSIKTWGPYPTLIDGPPENVVNGVAYEVQNEEYEKRLAYYETDAYRCTTCLIKPASGGDQIVGKTFVWAGEPNDRILRPGSFDLEAWKKARYRS